MFLPRGGCSLPLWDALALHILPPCIPYPLGYPTHKKGHKTRDTPPPTTKAAGTHPTWMLFCYVIAIAITIRLKNGLCTHYYNCDCKSYSIHRKESQSQSQHCRIKGSTRLIQTRLIPYSLCRKFRQLILPFMNRSINFYRSQMKLRLRGRFYFTPICQSFYSQGSVALYDVTSYLAAWSHVPLRGGLCLWSHFPSRGFNIPSWEYLCSGGLPDWDPLWTETPWTETPLNDKEQVICILLECILVFQFFVLLQCKGNLNIRF